MGASAAAGAFIISTTFDNDELIFVRGGPFMMMIGAAALAALARRAPKRDQRVAVTEPDPAVEITVEELTFTTPNSTPVNEAVDATNPPYVPPTSIDPPAKSVSFAAQNTE